jgi:IS30 family transposase
VPERARLTLTWDQGSEMADHDRIAVHFAEGVYFAHPASPWQRGTNENTNGLLRQYFPKRTDLSVHTLADLFAVEERLNHRRRKVLGWQSGPDLPRRGDKMSPSTLRRWLESALGRVSKARVSREMLRAWDEVT